MASSIEMAPLTRPDSTTDFSASSSLLLDQPPLPDETKDMDGGDGSVNVYVAVGQSEEDNSEAAPSPPCQATDPVSVCGPPRRSLLQLFILFLGIGLRGFGGPVVQINTMKQQLVLEEHWISIERFNRVYAFYQAIPGPEATELAIFFGYTSNGFFGGVLGGIGFIFPGFCIMLLFSFLYGQYGLSNAYVKASFTTVEPVVTGMIFTSLRKLAEHSFIDSQTKSFTYLLLFQGFLGTLLTVMRINFLITLAFVGLFNGILSWRVRSAKWAYIVAIAWLGLGLLTYVLVVVYVGMPSTFTVGGSTQGEATYASAFGVAMLAGLLTFGGAYTAIPYIQEVAVVSGQWITAQQFIDGLALANLVPSPLIMFITFVGYLALSWGGAIVMTIGIFAPGFFFALAGHHLFNRILDNKTIMPFLEGVTAAVIGIVLITACNFLSTSVTNPVGGAIFFLTMFILNQVKGPYTGVILIAFAATCGQALFAPPL